MEQYKYTLDKSSKKFICPKCESRSFVKYMDNEKLSYLPDEFGRCDRETNCGYHKAPSKGIKCYLIPFISNTSISDKANKLTDVNGIDTIIPKSQIIKELISCCWISEWFLKNSSISYLANEYKYFDNNDIDLTNTIIKNEKTIESVPSFHPIELLDKMYFESPQIDNLSEFLKTKFSIEEVFNAMQNYFISGTNCFWNNSTAFWQIDENQKIHACKIMLYDKTNGKRIKIPHNHINWLHNAVKVPNFNLCQCLFGLHLINEDYGKTIAIVESEKTAIILSIFLPDYIWIATGSKQNLKLDLFTPIKKRNIVLFPDKGEYADWYKKASELNQIGFKIEVSDLIEQTNYANGFDLADYYLSL
ncbi:MAG: DUF6371 domain-containing protein [Flavobacterium sp.]|uniref:DUF6371 domain-containing protein n=1 Tax=Flavobacterium sp. TaxID=239 RepID=UPI003BE8B399